jgi:hypothetical protein
MTQTKPQGDLFSQAANGAVKSANVADVAKKILGFS